jgi:hypothetical protein
MKTEREHRREGGREADTAHVDMQAQLYNCQMGFVRAASRRASGGHLCRTLLVFCARALLMAARDYFYLIAHAQLGHACCPISAPPGGQVRRRRARETGSCDAQ